MTCRFQSMLSFYSDWFMWLIFGILQRIKVCYRLFPLRSSLCLWQVYKVLHGLDECLLLFLNDYCGFILHPVELNRGFFLVTLSSLTTYLCPSLPVEHRPPTTPSHRILFWAALVIPDQLAPCCFSSASVSRLQLLRGRPLFLFPYGFQVRAWRVVLNAGFLRVCPIQPHFLRSICLATGSCPARSHRSSFRIFSCHWIL